MVKVPGRAVMALSASLLLAVTNQSKAASSITDAMWSDGQGSTLTFKKDHVIERIGGKDYRRDRKTCREGQAEAFDLKYSVMDVNEIRQWVQYAGGDPRSLSRWPAGRYEVAKLSCYESLTLYVRSGTDLVALSGGEGELSISRYRPSVTQPVASRPIPPERLKGRWTVASIISFPKAPTWVRSETVALQLIGTVITLDIDDGGSWVNAWIDKSGTRLQKEMTECAVVIGAEPLGEETARDERLPASVPATATRARVRVCIPGDMYRAFYVLDDHTAAFWHGDVLYKAVRQ